MSRGCTYFLLEVGRPLGILELLVRQGVSVLQEASVHQAAEEAYQAFRGAPEDPVGAEVHRILTNLVAEAVVERRIHPVAEAAEVLLACRVVAEAVVVHRIHQVAAAFPGPVAEEVVVVHLGLGDLVVLVVLDSF